MLFAFNFTLCSPVFPLTISTRFRPLPFPHDFEKLISTNSLRDTSKLYKAYSAKAFLSEYHWKLAKPPPKLLSSFQKWLRLGWGVFLSDFFFTLFCRLICSLVCGVSPSKTSGGAELLRARGRLEASAMGIWRLVCVSGKAAFTTRGMWTKTCYTIWG